jgi:hypothetical protein
LGKTDAHTRSFVVAPEKAVGEESHAKDSKKIVTDEAYQPVAVQIDYNDWLIIERSLGLPDDVARVTDLSRYHGLISLTEDPLVYQARIRNEWS